ncbi:family 43 glycosylhydrolase [Horticoccus sp. 23ND18S-11]|uniref:family 43 glycosylhydrolase n=1 Tax=Horticoccus sp. 23ND18S-11 TaxID=3391832 RepID=UPI0039C94CFB
MQPPCALFSNAGLGRAGLRFIRSLIGLGAVATALTIGGVGLCAESTLQRNTHFRPGQPWLDTQGTHLNAHGFCIVDFGGRHYWYGAHKIAGKTEAEKNEAGVRCYVSDDLLNWQDAGLVLDVFAPGAHPELADASILDRPKVIFHAATKKFILYFKLYPPKAQGGKSGTDYAYVGVATATAPTGPFEYQGRFLGGNSPFGTGDFAIFSDTDGAVYHLGVRKPDKAHVCGRLSDDGLRPSGDYVELAGITPATEAPALFRRGNKIYFLGSGSSGWAPNAARMFVADRVTGPYQDLGNPVLGVNPHNHLGPEKTFGGQSTFVYPVAGRRDAWIAMFDINLPQNPITSGYIWLPIEFEGDRPIIRWRNEWDLSIFSKK